MIKKILVVLLSTMAAIVTTELYLRSKPHTTIKFYDNDIFGSALAPNQEGWFVSAKDEYASRVSVNSQGWPDIEHSFEKKDDVYRVVIIGDSFVENFQVPFEKRFFRQLQEKLGRKFEVIALGRGNTGTAPQYLILKNFGLKYHPDLVIHLFFEANDLKNNSPTLQNDPFLPYYQINQGGDLVKVPHSKRSDRNLSKVKEFLTNFQLTVLLLSIRQNIIQNQELQRSGYPIDYRVYDTVYDQNYLDSWEVTKKLILETKTETEKAGAKYLLIPFPGAEQIQPKSQNKIFELYPMLDKSKIDFEKPDRLLVDFCEEKKIQCQSLFPMFKESIRSNPNQELFFFYDGHWNEEGTNLAAVSLFDILQENYGIK